VARILAVLVPVVLLLIPAFRIVPALYRWRMSSRIYRWYGALQRLEHEAHKSVGDAVRRQALLRELDQIENSVQKIVVPAAFGDLFYGLRGHIGAVRKRLQAPVPAAG
jgi:hypothetical protein